MKDKKPLECKFCKKIFTIELSEHIASVHEGKKANWILVLQEHNEV